jgi:hypothetical protein
MLRRPASIRHWRVHVGRFRRVNVINFEICHMHDNKWRCQYLFLLPRVLAIVRRTHNARTARAYINVCISQAWENRRRDSGKKNIWENIWNYSQILLSKWNLLNTSVSGIIQLYVNDVFGGNISTILNIFISNIKYSKTNCLQVFLVTTYIASTKQIKSAKNPLAARADTLFLQIALG